METKLIYLFVGIAGGVLAGLYETAMIKVKAIPNKYISGSLMIGLLVLMLSYFPYAATIIGRHDPSYIDLAIMFVPGIIAFMIVFGILRNMMQKKS